VKGDMRIDVATVTAFTKGGAAIQYVDRET
jgi:hypothetical protein